MANADLELGQFVQEVRLYLRDFPELNRLIDGEETSDRMIAWAVLDALDDINNSPPPLPFWSVSGFPYRHLLLRGTVITLLESIGLLQTRNHLAFNDGGISVSVSDKAPMLMNWINLLRSTYENKKLRFKISQNISRALDETAIATDYYFLGGYYDLM